MKLSELLGVMNGYTVIQVVDARSIAVFHGEVSIAGEEMAEWYKSATVVSVYPEYYKGWGKTGITIIVKP